MIKVAFDGGDRAWRMSADLGGSELGPRDKVAGINGSTPSRKCWREHGGVVVCHPVGDGGGGVDERVGDGREGDSIGEVGLWSGR